MHDGGGTAWFTDLRSRVTHLLAGDPAPGIITAMSKPVICVVGLRFGRSFADLYRLHPEVGEVAICDTDPAALAAARAELGLTRTYSSFEEVLRDPGVDAVHLATPIPLHARQAVAAMEAGKHVACAVPAAVALDDCAALVAAERRTGRRYFMAETAAYGGPFLLVQELIRRGEFGRIQHLRGVHFQDMEGWPGYWAGLPPMWYATHALVPLAILAGTPISQVTCFGSGVMHAELRAQYGNPWPIETANFRFAGGELSANVTRSLFAAAVRGLEETDIIGEKMSLWSCHPSYTHTLVRIQEAQPGRWGRGAEVREVVPPLRWDLLSPGFRERIAVAPPERADLPAHTAHHGSHPHLVDEFVRCQVDGRPSAIDAAKAANWCAAGVIAHQSAMQGGALLDVPSFAG